MSQENVLRFVKLTLGEGAVLVKNGEKYEIPKGHSHNFNFPEGIILKTSTTSTEEFILLKDHYVPSNLKISRDKISLSLKAGTKLKKSGMNADITLNETETFILGGNSKVIVPKGTLLCFNKITFLKDDEVPMYFSC